MCLRNSTVGAWVYHPYANCSCFAFAPCCNYCVPYRNHCSHIEYFTHCDRFLDSVVGEEGRGSDQHPTDLAVTLFFVGD